MEKDLKRLEACYEHEDYYAMLIYIEMIINNYYGIKQQFLLQIISSIKKGNYDLIKNILKILKIL